MPFTLVRGSFHLTNLNSAGKPIGFEPDGDSIQFKPDNPELLKRLKVLRASPRLTKIGSVQLRFEGMDALELHYSPPGGAITHQPRPLADAARDFLIKQLHLAPVQYAPPDYLRVQPPAQKDGARGYILARSLEVYGRPVSFAFAGKPPAADGARVALNVTLLKKSVNYKSLLNGQAYPLFYDSLFRELRAALAAAARAARQAKRGLWKKDVTQTGIALNDQSDLEARGVIFPKLFRRLSEYLATGTTRLAGFTDFLEMKNEQVLNLDPKSREFTNFTHFDNLVSVKRGKVALKLAPENILFVSEK